MPDVAVVGLGRIGLPVAGRLVAAGHRVRAHDVRVEVRADAETAGAVWADDAGAAVAHAELLITVLPGSPELRELMLGDDGLMARLGPETSWIDLTSAAPDLGAELAAAAARRDIPYLDAALGGGPGPAAAGELTLYVGGDAAVVERLHDYLAVLAAPERIHHLGAAGAGYLTKLIVNALWFTQAVASAELMLAGQDGGIAPERLREVLQATPASNDFAGTYLPRLLDGDYLESFGVDRIVEELESLERHLRLRGLPTDVLTRVTEVHRAALRRFGPVDGELAGVAEVEQRAGTTLRQPPRR